MQSDASNALTIRNIAASAAASIAAATPAAPSKKALSPVSSLADRVENNWSINDERKANEAYDPKAEEEYDDENDLGDDLLVDPYENERLAKCPEAVEINGNEEEIEEVEAHQFFVDYNDNPMDSKHAFDAKQVNQQIPQISINQQGSSSAPPPAPAPIVIPDYKALPPLIPAPVIGGIPFFNTMDLIIQSIEGLDHNRIPRLKPSVVKPQEKTTDAGYDRLFNEQAKNVEHFTKSKKRLITIAKQMRKRVELIGVMSWRLDKYSAQHTISTKIINNKKKDAAKQRYDAIAKKQKEMMEIMKAAGVDMDLSV